MIYALFLIGLSMFLSATLQPAVRRMAIRLGAVDRPGERKRHQGEIPRWGGLGLAISVYLTIVVGKLVSDWLGFVWESVFPRPWLVLAALTGVLLLGMIDDVTRMRALPKAVVQALCAWLIWRAGIRVEILTNPFSEEPLRLGLLSAPLTILWIMTVTNAFNLIDGLDGLAAGLAIVGLAGFSIVALFRNETMILYAVAPILGAILGFLPYNFPRAVSFLGDSGAYFVGFALGTFSIMTNQKGATAVVAFAPLLFIALPVADVLGTMLRRFRSVGEAPLRERLSAMFKPDRKHLHYLIVDAGIARGRASVLLIGVGLVVALLGLAAVLINDRRLGFMLLLAGLFSLLLLVLRPPPTNE